MTERGVVVGPDGVTRCKWSDGNDEYRDYHDNEWGYPVGEDHRIYEKICLEGFQSGLSWITVLRKRPAFREVFLGFDPEKAANFGSSDVERLLGDDRIIRHRGKIEATIINAQATLRVQETYGSLSNFVWSFEPERSVTPALVKLSDAVATTPGSMALSQALRFQGFKFFGPTTAYAAMQSLGIINDHFAGCPRWEACESARTKTPIQHFDGEIPLTKTTSWG